MAAHVVGDVRWNGRAQRWTRWSGRDWSRATHSADPGALVAPDAFERRAPIDEQRRRRVLDQAIDDALLDGATVIHREEYRVTLGYRRAVSHVLHAVLTLLTAGAWGLVWLIMAIARKDDRVKLTVDRWGHVWPELSPR